MKVQNVIRGYMSRYEVTDISIIEADGYNVIYSGEYNHFFSECDVTMVLYRDRILSREVIASSILNNRKVFVFI